MAYIFPQAARMETYPALLQAFRADGRLPRQWELEHTLVHANHKVIGFRFTVMAHPTNKRQLVVVGRRHEQQ
eukprot:395443-Prymnesium_polylepis.1